MILAVDVGNTNIVWGLYEEDKLRHYWRTRTDRNLSGDELGVLLSGLLHLEGLSLSACTDVVVGSVVPSLRASLKELCNRRLGCEPFFVGPDATGGIQLKVDDPSRVGSDRIANVAAAWDRYRRSLIVVDFGTATNFDVVDENGAFIGGAIAPGVIISTEALFKSAAALSRVELVPPVSVIGKDTVSNVQAGIVVGAAGLVDGIVQRIREELGDMETPVIATGGLAPLIAGESRTITEVDPYLTLNGLRLIYERTRGTKA